MEILVKRIAKKSKYTIGKMYIDGQYICDTLEDADRGLNQNMSLKEINNKKVYGETAIPTGTYTLVLSYSNRFKKVMPEILNVPNFSGIRIHCGNSSKDTEGCLLVGKWDGKTENWISDSKNSYNKLYPLLEEAFNKKENITITIKDIA